MSIFVSGLLLGLSLIMALGPQNIFLIRQGAFRQHAVMSAFTCFVCDVILVTLSVVGLHEILESHPGLAIWLSWLGALFLGGYGLLSIKRSWRAGNKAIELETTQTARKQIVLLAVGFSLLNPHAIIDSLVLIGGGSSQFPDHPKLFLSGVITSSLVWFSLLTSLAYFFSNALIKDKVWRRVELAGGLLMVYLGIQLALK